MSAFGGREIRRRRYASSGNRSRTNTNAGRPMTTSEAYDTNSS
jgi:hypothetical protein